MSEEQAQYGSAGVREVYEELKHMDHLNDQPCPKCRGEIGHRINCPDGGAFAGETLERRKQPLPSPEAEQGVDEALSYRWAARAMRGVEGRIEPHHLASLADLISSAILQAYHLGEGERYSLVWLLQEALELADWAVSNVADWNRELHAEMARDLATLQEKATKVLPPDAKN